MATYPVPPSFNQSLVYGVQIDSAPATLTIYYQVFGQRLYFMINDQTGNLLINMPLIPVAAIPNLLKGYATTSTLSYDPDSELVAILP